MNTLVTAFGAKGDGATDDTACIQSAINAAQPGDTVVVPPGKFMINGLVGADMFASGGLFLKSDMTLLLSAGAILQVIPNTSDHYTILTANRCQNLKIMGPGSIVGDRDTHKESGAVSQFGFGISIWGDCKNVTVQDVFISKLWGDGLTVIGASDVVIDGVVTDSCRRQNMSVIAVDGLVVTNCTFRNANFSGLDMEIDLANETIVNVVVRFCRFVGSGGPAHIGVGSPVGTYKNIKITNCQFDLKMQPIFAHDNAGSTGTPWWAFLLNRIFYEGLHAPTYRFVGYPTSWSIA